MQLQNYISTTYNLVCKGSIHNSMGQASIQLVLVIAWVAVKFGINITSVVLEMGINFTRRSRVKFTISNTTRVVFIPNFTATHAIPS